jgi:hypothetical protein
MANPESDYVYIHRSFRNSSLDDGWVKWLHLLAARKPFSRFDRTYRVYYVPNPSHPSLAVFNDLETIL